MSLLTQERFGSNRLTALHLASDCGKKEAIALLLGNGADPTIKDKLKKVLFSTTCLGVSSSCVSITIFGLSPTFLFYQVPYSYCPTTEARNAFRRFSGSNPERWDYKSAGIPAPLTEEDEERQREKKRRQREKKREKDRDKKAAEKELREQVCQYSIVNTYCI